ncbi:MvdC/MvdD family ATP grasp protein [Streptomyces diacarni]|uniref:MvdC/MvdD family ATP grasp protein n=1 Tax=Streptomyces diacarni TaxID=2800381 RepID=UPI0033E2241E
MSVPGAVVVLTSADDLAADKVVLELGRLGTPVLRFDPARQPVTLAASHGPAGWHGTLSTGAHHVRLEDIRAVWWWHPSPLAHTSLRPRDIREWAQRETVAGLTGVLHALPCLHLNHPERVTAAQNKADVLARATECGLRVPATWIGNSYPSATRFASGSPGELVGKALASPQISLPDGSARTFFTTSLPPDGLDETVESAVHQFQRRIDKVYEVRLTVIGSSMFPVRIDAHSARAREDFRADYESLSYSVIPLPAEVRQGIADLMDSYGLAYATVDLLVDGDGTWWLVDLNPAGRWSWLETALPDLGVTTALARLLGGTLSPLRNDRAVEARG